MHAIKGLQPDVPLELGDRPDLALGPGPRWLEIAAQELGVTQHPPGQSNPRITEYHDGTNICGYDDKASWCSSFVNWCLLRSGWAGTGSALARSWLDWGRPLQDPVPGCVVVLWRDDPATWRGHVGFFLRADADQLVLLGGNQLGQVRAHGYPRAQLLGLRWPEVRRCGSPPAYARSTTDGEAQ